jgi:hypothetical protein
MTSETVVLVSNVTGAVFAGLYGLYATVTDFHKTEHGKKVLSRKGKVGLSLLLLATVLNVTSGAFKQRADLISSHEESKKRDAETARIQSINNQLGTELAASATMSSSLKDALRTLSQTDETTAQNLKATERLLDPIHDSTIAEAYFRIPIDQPFVRPYVNRVKNTGFALRVDQDSFPKENVPDEEILYRFLTRLTVQIIFTKNLGHNTLAFRMECKSPHDDSLNTEMKLDSRDLRLLCRTLASKQSDDGSFHSYSDLLGARIRITVADFVTPVTGGAGKTAGLVLP